jgi:hypothetical protein
VFNFTQDDLLSEDIMILDGQNAIHVWVGQHASSNDKVKAWDIAQVPLFPSHQKRVLPKLESLWELVSDSPKLCGQLLQMTQDMAHSNVYYLFSTVRCPKTTLSNTS